MYFNNWRPIPCSPSSHYLPCNFSDESKDWYNEMPWFATYSRKWATLIILQSSFASFTDWIFLPGANISESFVIADSVYTPYRALLCPPERFVVCQKCPSLEQDAHIAVRHIHTTPFNSTSYILLPNGIVDFAKSLSLLYIRGWLVPFFFLFLVTKMFLFFCPHHFSCSKNGLWIHNSPHAISMKGDEFDVYA